MGVESKVDVQRDGQDFRGCVQRGHFITDFHLWVDPGLVGIQNEQSHSYWILRAMASCFPFAHLTKVEHSRLASPHLSLHNAGSRGQQCEVVSIGRHVYIGDGTIQQKMVKEGWGDDRKPVGPLPTPRRKASGAVGKGLRPSSRECMPLAI